jgi:hypothetical protein
MRSFGLSAFQLVSVLFLLTDVAKDYSSLFGLSTGVGVAGAFPTLASC